MCRDLIVDFAEHCEKMILFYKAYKQMTLRAKTFLLISSIRFFLMPTKLLILLTGVAALSPLL